MFKGSHKNFVHRRSNHGYSSTRYLHYERLENRTLLAADVTFAEPVNYPAGGSPGRVITGDVDSDGLLDLIVGNDACCGGGGRVSVLLGEGDGTFSPQSSFSAGHIYIGAADFDADGDLDIGVAHPSQGFSVILNEGSTGNEWNGFGRPTSRIPMDRAPQDVLSADLDNDGDMDVVVGSAESVRVLLNNGVAIGQWQGFADPYVYNAGEHPSRVATGDVDGDGDLDLVVRNFFSEDVSVLMGNGDGTFQDAVHYPVGRFPGSVQLTDLDGDNDLDVAVALADQRIVAVLIGNGDGTFAERVHLPISSSASDVHAGDFDGDGDVDLAVEAYSGTRLTLLINRGDGSFQEQENAPTGGDNPQSRAVADLDGDGRLDLAVVTAFQRGLSCGNCGVEVWLNTTELPVVGPRPGDSNMDGTFNQLDIVLVLQASKYLTGEPAKFAEGDWTGDGVFDQLDIVAALATGSYLQGPSAARTLVESVDEVLENE